MLAQFGCSDGLVLEWPQGADYWAMVALDVDHEIVGSTPLLSGAEKLELEVPVGARAYVLGYGPGLMERLEVATPGPEPLAEAQGCELRLPPPAALQAVAFDRLEEAELSELPPLTVPWLARRCEDLNPASVFVDSGCVPVQCSVPVAREGCTLHLDGSICDFGAVSVTLGLDGEICLSTDTCQPEPRPPATLAHFSCSRKTGVGSCPIKLLPKDEPLAAALERVQIVDTAPYFPTSARYRPVQLRAGRASDLLVTESIVFVTSSDSVEPARERCKHRGQKQRLLAYAKEDLRPLFDRELTRCALSPLELPDQGILAFHIHDASDLLLIQRLDFDGELVQTTSTSIASFQGPAVIDTLRLGPDQNIVAIGSIIEPLSQLISVRDDGSVNWMVELELLEPSGLARFQDGFVVSDAERDGLWSFGPDGVQREIVLITDSVSRSPGPPYAHSASGSVLVPIPRDTAYVVSLQTDRTLHPRRVVNNERPVVPTAIGGWPSEASLVIVGLTQDSPEPAAYGGLLDPVEGHYLPGLLPLGPGAVSVVRTDTEGRVYLLLSWAAQLVRLTPP